MINLIKAFAVLALFVISMLTLCNVWYCGAAGIVDASTLSTRTILSEIQIGRRNAESGLTQEILTTLGDASSVVPDAAEYYEEAAYIYSVKGVFALRFSEISSPILRSATVKYEKALGVRPMSSVGWANLGLVNYYLSPESEKTDKFVDIAMRYGASDPKTQNTLFFLELQRWDRLSSSQKNQMRDVFIHAQEPFKSDLKRLVARFGNREFDNL